MGRVPAAPRETGADSGRHVIGYESEQGTPTGPAATGAGMRRWQPPGEPGQSATQGAGQLLAEQGLDLGVAGRHSGNSRLSLILANREKGYTLSPRPALWPVGRVVRPPYGACTRCRLRARSGCFPASVRPAGVAAASQPVHPAKRKAVPGGIRIGPGIPLGDYPGRV
jgi:hypothetical protein